MVQTVSGVKQNLWRRRESGLYAPARRIFPIDGLVLYAPLWHPELNVSPFTSKDLNAHSCTVVGATWGSQGRTFDGTDDNISLGDPASLDFGTGSFSVLVWVKGNGTSTSNRGIVSKWTVGNAGYTCFTESGAFRFYISDSVDTVYIIGSTNIETPQTFFLCAGVVDRETQFLKVFVNGVQEGGSTDITLVGSVTNALNLRIGAWSDLMAGRFFPGTIKSVWIYNRALSAIEINHIYLATKWRNV